MKIEIPFNDFATQRTRRFVNRFYNLYSRIWKSYTNLHRKLINNFQILYCLVNFTHADDMAESIRLFNLNNLIEIIKVKTCMTDHEDI